jgi:FkbM family methyltransferase
MEMIRKVLRPLYWRWFNPLYELNTIIQRAELTKEGFMFVETSDGTKLYGVADRKLIPPAQYGNKTSMDKIAGFRHFGSFLLTMHDSYVKSVYEESYKLREGDVVIDLGASVGTFTVKAAKAVGEKGETIAVEPEVAHLKLLRKNIEENGLQNVTVIPKGVWSSREQRKLYLSQDTDVQHSLYSQNSQGTQFSEAFEYIELDTLDNLLQELGIQGIDFIKMDIEGAEVEALKGMKQTLSCTSALAMEAIHLYNDTESYHTVIPELQKSGFSVKRNGGMLYANRI